MFTHVPRVLIVFGTWYGQTELIARRLALLARRRGYVAEVQSAGAAWARPDLDTFDRFVVCAGVQMRRHHRDVVAFVRTHVELLSARPSAFVSVSLSAGAPEGSPDRLGLDEVTRQFTKNTGWSPDSIIHAAGGLHYTRYGFLTRWFMRRISAQHDGPTDTSRDHELTDWARLEGDAASFLPEVPLAAASPVGARV